MSMLEILKQKFPQAIQGSHCDEGDETVFVERAHLYDLCLFLRDNPQCPFNLLLDICGVDYLGANPRFEVVYHLYSLAKKVRLRIRVKVPQEDPTVRSVIDIWETADWFEREAYDMFGICFEGHPNLKRLLLWSAFEGYPLRKDYPLNKRQPIPESEEDLLHATR